ncbi:hypothetical protein RINTHM_750 [Richelia intracellularis HM01]|nr:hypothetical protein RINTHM_750 [Richelia intracellularis HM01]
MHLLIHNKSTLAVKLRTEIKKVESFVGVVIVLMGYTRM